MKRGKGGKVRRQLTLWKRKTGGGKFQFKGGARHPSPLFEAVPQSAGAGLLGSLLKAMGFRTQNR
jgi:hypothetical protein